MSGEKDKLNNEDNFKKFYLDVKKNTKKIPNINKLKHGNSFYNEEFNGYDLSYLSIRYLNEILSYEEFINLMSNFSKIKEFGEDIINNMFDYYDKKIMN